MADEQPQLDPSQLEGRHRSRVFIGGSYAADHREFLERLTAVVRAAGFVPVVADLYRSEPSDDMHYVTMALLHSCRLAIFELSTASGALMEIERLPDYGTRALVPYGDPNKKGWRVSRMLETFVREHASSIQVQDYIQPETAEAVARDWLAARKAEGFG